MNRTLDQLVKGISPENDVPAVLIHGITTHSAQVNPGHLYIAIHGTNLDGHDFIPQAIANGAAAVITNGSIVISKLFMHRGVTVDNNHDHCGSDFQYGHC